MTGRIIWFAVLIGIALVTTALQFDLKSKSAPQLAALVPDPLRNYAQVQIARSAVAGNDPAIAVAETERLLRRRPIPSEYLTLLAAGQVKAGRTDQAAMTIQIAGQRGWRDPIAQEAVLRLALAAGDKPEAARRYAALFLRDRTPDALLKEVGPAVLDESGGLGQATMVAIIVGGDRWHSLFIRRGARVMPPAAFTAMVATSMDKGVRFDCPALDQAYRSIKQRDEAAAQQLQASAGGDCPKLRAKGNAKL
jgi:hypothetical protein